MTNNDVLRRLRYTFDLRDHQVVNIFSLVGASVTSTQVINWLRKDEDQQQVALEDHQLSNFLNGFIIKKRGRRDGDLPKADQSLSKNLILMKLKIALNLQAEDIIAMLKENNLVIGRSELSAFFRKPDHKNYRHCKAQFLRNFLQGIEQKFYVKRSTKTKLSTDKSNSSAINNKSVKSQANTQSKKQSKAKGKTLYVNPKAVPNNSKNKRKTLTLKP